MDDQAASGAFAMLLGMGCLFFVLVFAIIWAIKIFICYLLYSCLNRIPQAYRRQDPKLVWLLLIPLFSLIWAFFVWPKIADSFKGYFTAQGRTDIADAGQSLAYAYCICGACLIIPYLNALAGLASLVLLIILLVKFVGYKNQIPLNITPGSPQIAPGSPITRPPV